MRSSCFLSTIRVLWCYLFRCESSETNASGVLESISSLCFPPGKRAIYPTDVSMELFVEIVYYAGLRQFDFSMKHIVFGLLVPPSSLVSIDSLLPERAIIALRAFLKMTNDIICHRTKAKYPHFKGFHQRNAVNLPGDYDDHLFLNEMPIALEADAGESELIPADVLRHVGIITDMKKMSSVISDIMRHLHVMLGGYTYASLDTTKSATTRSLAEKQVYIDLFCTILRGMPRLFPGRLSDAQVCQIVANCTLHLDRNLRLVAFKTVERLMDQCPSLRLVLMSYLLATFTSVSPYRTPFITVDIAGLFTKIVRNWASDVNNPSRDSDIAILRLPEGLSITNFSSARAVSHTGTRKDRSLSQSLSSNNTLSSMQQSGPSIASLRDQLATVHRLEGLSATLLCSSTPAIRVSALEILHACNDLIVSLDRRAAVMIEKSDVALSSPSPASSSSSSWVNYTTIHAVLTQLSDDIIKSHDVDSGTNTTAPLSVDASLGIKAETDGARAGRSLRMLAGSGFLHEQSMWSMCLGDFWRILHTRCAHCICPLWPEVVERLSEAQTIVEAAVQNEVGPSLSLSAFGTRVEPLSEEVLFRWRNYLTCAVAISHIDEISRLTTAAPPPIPENSVGSLVDSEATVWSPDASTAALHISTASATLASNLQKDHLAENDLTVRSVMSDGVEMKLATELKTTQHTTSLSWPHTSGLIPVTHVATRPPQSTQSVLQGALKLLRSDSAPLRMAIVSALQSVNRGIYRLLVTEIRNFQRILADSSASSRTKGNKYKKRANRIRLDLSEIMANTAHVFSSHNENAISEKDKGSGHTMRTTNCSLLRAMHPLDDESLVRLVIDYIMEMKVFLTEAAGQLIWELPMLRFHYCRLAFLFYDSASSKVKWSKYLPVQIRASLFYFFDDWRGGSEERNEVAKRHLESKFYLSMLNKTEEKGENGLQHSYRKPSVEDQLKMLEAQALMAMCALCKGPLYVHSAVYVTTYTSIAARGRERWLFDLDGLLSWFEYVFLQPEEVLFSTARASLSIMIQYNSDRAELMDRVLSKCFSLHSLPPAANGFFLALVDAFSAAMEKGDVIEQLMEREIDAGKERREDEQDEENYEMGMESLEKPDETDENKEKPKEDAEKLESRPDSHTGKDVRGLKIVDASEDPGGRRPVIELSRAVDMSEAQHHNHPATNMAERGESLSAKSPSTWFAVEPSVLLVLVLYKMPDFSHHVRKAAVLLLQTVESCYFLDRRVNHHEISLSGCLPVGYTLLRDTLFVRVANTHHELAYQVFSEVVRRCDCIGSNGQRHLLNVSYPWMASVYLEMEHTELMDHSNVFLTNLFYLTAKYDSAFSDELEALWGGLVDRQPNNLVAVLHFLIRLCMQRKNPLAIKIAKKIVTYLGRIDDRQDDLVYMLISLINAETILSNGHWDVTARKSSSGAIDMHSGLYLAPLDEVVPEWPQGTSLAVGELCFLFVTNLVLEVGDRMWQHLPLLLHVAFVQMDHVNLLVCEHSRMILMNLIHALILREDTEDFSVLSMSTDIVNANEGDDSYGLWMDARMMISEFEKKKGTRLWKNDDMRADSQQVKDPVELKTYLYRVLALFGRSNDLSQQWGELALSWAVTCPMRHVASRSLQIFTAIMPNFSEHDVAVLYLRMAETVADEHNDVQAFALEELNTVRAMVGTMNGQMLLEYPLLFWGTVALLLSNVEYEFLHALNLLGDVLWKVNLGQEIVETELLMFAPSNWRCPFVGLQPMLLKGLFSRVTITKTMRLLVELTFNPASKIIDNSGSRVLFSILVFVPWLVKSIRSFIGKKGDRHFGDNSNNLHSNRTISSSANTISSQASNATCDTSMLSSTAASVNDATHFCAHPSLVDDGLPFGLSLGETEELVSRLLLMLPALPASFPSTKGLARILMSFVKRRVRSEEEFLKQLCNELAELFFPSFQVDAVKFLLEMIKFGPKDDRPIYVGILKEVVSRLMFSKSIGDFPAVTGVNDPALKEQLSSDGAHDALATTRESSIAVRPLLQNNMEWSVWMETLILPLEQMSLLVRPVDVGRRTSRSLPHDTRGRSFSSYHFSSSLAQDSPHAAPTLGFFGSTRDAPSNQSDGAQSFYNAATVLHEFLTHATSTFTDDNHGENGSSSFLSAAEITSQRDILDERWLLPSVWASGDLNASVVREALVHVVSTYMEASAMPEKISETAASEIRYDPLSMSGPQRTDDIVDAVMDQAVPDRVAEQYANANDAFPPTASLAARLSISQRGTKSFSAQPSPSTPSSHRAHQLVDHELGYFQTSQQCCDEEEFVHRIDRHDGDDESSIVNKKSEDAISESHNFSALQTSSDVIPTLHRDSLIDSSRDPRGSLGMSVLPHPNAGKARCFSSERFFVIGDTGLLFSIKGTGTHAKLPIFLDESRTITRSLATLQMSLSSAELVSTVNFKEQFEHELATAVGLEGNDVHVLSVEDDVINEHHNAILTVEFRRGLKRLNAMSSLSDQVAEQGQHIARIGSMSDCLNKYRHDMTPLSTTVPSSSITTTASSLVAHVFLLETVVRQLIVYDSPLRAGQLSGRLVRIPSRMIMETCEDRLQYVPHSVLSGVDARFPMMTSSLSENDVFSAAALNSGSLSDSKQSHRTPWRDKCRPMSNTAGWPPTTQSESITPATLKNVIVSRDTQPSFQTSRKPSFPSSAVVIRKKSSDDFVSQGKQQRNSSSTSPVRRHLRGHSRTKSQCHVPSVAEILGEQRNYEEGGQRTSAGDDNQKAHHWRSTDVSHRLPEVDDWIHFVNAISGTRDGDILVEETTYVIHRPVSLFWMALHVVRGCITDFGSMLTRIEVRFQHVSPSVQPSLSALEKDVGVCGGFLRYPCEWSAEDVQNSEKVEHHVRSCLKVSGLLVWRGVLYCYSRVILGWLCTFLAVFLKECRDSNTSPPTHLCIIV